MERAQGGARDAQLLREALVAHEDSAFRVARRKTYALSQALSIAVCALLLKLQMCAAGRVSKDACAGWAEHGFPVLFEGLLSMTNLIGKERGMAEDCAAAFDALRLFSLSVECLADPEARSPTVDMALRKVTLALPRTLIDALPSVYATAPALRLVPIYFNQGIDIVQTLAAGKAEAGKRLQSALSHLTSNGAAEETQEASNASERQLEVNLRALRRLNDYLHAARPVEDEGQAAIVDLAGAPARLHPLAAHLHELVAGAKLSAKNVDMLCEVERVASALDACRVTFCKSGKDRTGMCVTLEQSRVLGEVFGCGQRQERLLRDANVMRVHGVRIMVAEKNIGRRVYSINKLQAQFLPLLYRPPAQVQEDLMKTDET